jgi:predicted GNAT family acetyltransferase
MDEIKLRLDENGDGAFYIIDGAIQLGEMVVSITNKNITVYHTEVVPEAEGKGLAKKMLQAMVDYARNNKRKVIPLCPYVHAQFKRRPEDYADVWQKAQQSSND